MLKFLQIALIVGAFSFIFLSVYVATLPSIYIKEEKVVYNSFTLTPIKKQLINFENWRNWNTMNPKKFFFSSNKDPLLSQLKADFGKKGVVTVENQLISDTLIVQRIYGLGGKKASTLKWKLLKHNNSGLLRLRFEEYIGVREKVLKKLKTQNHKSDWLYELFNNLEVLIKLSEKETEVLHLPKAQPKTPKQPKKSKGNIIYLEKQN